MPYSPRPAAPRKLAAALLAALLALPAGLGCSESPTPGPRTEPQRALPTTTAHQSSVPLGTDSGSGLITTAIGERCVECHGDVVDSYATGAMHASLSLPAGAGSIEASLVGRVIVSPETGMTARFDAVEGRYAQTLFYVDPTGVERVSFSTPIDVVIGSGRTTRSYLHVRDGRFLELPLAWDRRTGGLVTAPGVDAWERALRPAGNTCIACHAGDATPVRTDASVGFTGQVSLGISCERCHGASDEHVANGEPGSTVNPARLPAARQEELCVQCHRTDGIVVESFERTIASYTPGASLSGWLSIFRPETLDTTAHADTAGPGVRLRMSACFVASEASERPLTCATCHNPHSAAPHDGSAHAADRGCLTCHAREVCPAPEAATGDVSCSACHMSVARDRGAAHTTVTDHFIRRPPLATPHAPPRPRVPSAGELALAGGRLVDALDPEGAGDAHVRRAARAYTRGVLSARRAHSQDAEEWRRRAFALAGALLQRDANDAQALDLRGRLLLSVGNSSGAIALLETAHANAPNSPSAVADLAYARAEALDFVRAEPLLARVLELDPYDEDVAIARARVLVELKRRDDALRVLEDLRARIGPSIKRSHLASEIANGGGDLEGALRHTFDVLLFVPRAPDVHTKIGEILLALGDDKRARVHLTEALRVDPRFAPALRILAEMEAR